MARVHTADRNRRHGKRSLCAIAEGIRKSGSDLIERRHRALTVGKRACGSVLDARKRVVDLEGLCHVGRSLSSQRVPPQAAKESRMEASAGSDGWDMVGGEHTPASARRNSSLTFLPHGPLPPPSENCCGGCERDSKGGVSGPRRQVNGMRLRT